MRLERDPVELAGGVHRHLVEEHHLLGRLVADALARELDELVARRTLGAVLDGDVGAHVLAVHLVVDADHADERDRGVFGQRLFDLDRD